MIEKHLSCYSADCCLVSPSMPLLTAITFASIASNAQALNQSHSDAFMHRRDEAGSAGVRVAAGNRGRSARRTRARNAIIASRYLQWKYCGSDASRSIIHRSPRSSISRTVCDRLDWLDYNICRSGPPWKQSWGKLAHGRDVTRWSLTLPPIRRPRRLASVAIEGVRRICD
jgi:hypothetical protein